MASHSSTLAWKIPWMEEPGRLQSMGSLRVGHDRSDLAVSRFSKFKSVIWQQANGSKFWSLLSGGWVVAVSLSRRE